MIQENIEKILSGPKNSIGMDVIIISTNNPLQEHFWQKRLDEMKGHIVKHDAMIITITEDWPGGAGNGLGSLYAYQKASKKGNIDLLEIQKKGASIAIYHTAGKGKRLSPLTLSENNNKSAVKLPSLINGQPLTILEAAILQSGLFSPLRKGRLSVFWGDQVFIPSLSLNQNSHHVDILGKKIPSPDEKGWKLNNLDKYGVILFDHDGKPQLHEKISFEKYDSMIQRKKIDPKKGIAISFGSFSLSTTMTESLLHEFNDELIHKRGKFDSDPDFWMALTLSKDEYPYDRNHYQRMQKLKLPSLFDVVDIGNDSYWWDFGSIQSYFDNHMKLFENSSESDALRRFYQNDHFFINSSVQKKKIENSILINVNAQDLNVKNCILINSTFNSFQGDSNLLYNVQEKDPLKFSPREIRADVNNRFQLKSTLDRDGKNDWDKRLSGNFASYQEIEKIMNENSAFQMF